MNDSSQVTTLLSGLVEADPAARERAAAELFRQGCALAEPVFKQWFADADFRSLVSGRGQMLTVGVAVDPAQFEEIRRRCGQARLAQMPPDQDALEFELNFQHGVRLDVLTTRDPSGDGAIARFLAKFGAGIQQIECEVSDVTRATQMIRSRFALEPVYPETHAGANGARVNFFLVPVAEGRKVLVELVEAPQSKKKK
jgi:hypothetical protein